jgi:hypothetical protein
MRTLLTCLLVLLAASGFSQTASFISFKDTLNHFAIDIPSGWQYSSSKGLPLIAQRKPAETADKSHESFNVNVINKKTPSTVEREYEKFIGYLKSTNNFTLLESDTITINGQACKWFVENHKNDGDGVTLMCNYVFITYKNDKTYILTFATLAADFSKYRQLFYKIAETLVI